MLFRSLSPQHLVQCRIKPTFQAIDMTTSTKTHDNFIYGALGAIATIPPILLVVAASAMPEGLERGQFIVHGCGVILAVLATALVLRAAFAFGFSMALKMAASAESNYSVTA